MRKIVDRVQLSVWISKELYSRFRATENKTQVVIEALTAWFDQRDNK